MQKNLYDYYANLKWKKLHCALVLIVMLLPVFMKAQKLNDSTNQVSIPLTTRADSNIITLMSDIQKISLGVNNLSVNLTKGLTIEDIEDQLQDINNKLLYSQSYILTDEPHVSYRLLRLHSVLLEQLRLKMNELSLELKTKDELLVDTESKINKFLYDKKYDIVPQDSSIRFLYRSEYELLIDRIKRIDTLAKQRALQNSLLQAKLTKNYLLLSEISAVVVNKIETKRGSMLKKTEPSLFSVTADDYTKDFIATTKLSGKASSTILSYYLKTHKNAIISTILVFMLLIIWLIYLKSDYAKHYISYIRSFDFRLNFLQSSPIWTGLVLTFTLATFFFPTPPVIFTEALWTVVGTALVVITFKKGVFAKGIKIYWIVFFLLFRFVAGLNLMLFVTYAERWFIIFINIGCIISQILLFRQNKAHKIFQFYPALFITVLSVLLHVLSIIADIAGLFYLSKVLITAGTFSFFTAIVLGVFTEVAREAFFLHLSLLNKNLKEEEHKTSVKNLFQFADALIIIIAFLAWLFSLLNNLNIYDSLKKEVVYLFEKDIQLGDASIRTGTVLLFIAIILISSFISKIISLITDVASSKVTKFSFLSNLKLIINLTIITVGVFLAFMATGVSLDRLAIILGALGVGIGLGLQNLVSNLTSGIMLTVEKPIRVGDSIELGGVSGKVKEIGIRATRIEASNGSDILVPNSDMLSKHVINWTLTNPHKRFELHFTFDQNINIEMIKSELLNLFHDNHDILTTPTPSIKIDNLNNGGCEVVCYLWSERADKASSVKDKVLQEIMALFRKLNIETKEYRT